MPRTALGRSFAAGGHPACRIVVRADPTWATGQVAERFLRHRFRLLSTSAANPMVFRAPRWAAGGASLFAVGAAVGELLLPPMGRTQVGWQPAEPGEVLLSFEHRDRGGAANTSVAFVDTVTELVEQFASTGILAFASPIAPSYRDSSYLSPDYTNAAGYRGERGQDGRPLPWDPFRRY